jgi:hypothetical protein
MPGVGWNEGNVTVFWRHTRVFDLASKVISAQERDWGCPACFWVDGVCFSRLEPLGLHGRNGNGSARPAAVTTRWRASLEWCGAEHCLGSTRATVRMDTTSPWRGLGSRRARFKKNGPCHRRARATERKRGDKGEVGLQGGGCRGAGRSLSRCSSLGKKIGEREGKIWHTNANAWHAWPAPSSCQAKEIKRWCQVTRQIA